MGFYDSTVLIIEDSQAVIMMLSKYVKKMGFSKITTSATGGDGIKKFDELLSSGILPIVLLDYELEDMDAASIVPSLFSKSPEVKIILETSLDERDEQVRNLFSIGVSHFVPKPIRYQNMFDVINTIKAEFEIDDEVGLESDFDKIVEHLKIAHRSSVARIAQNCGYPSDQVLSFLRGMKSKGEILEMNSIKEVLCNKCQSVGVSTLFSCPSCSSSNFEQTKLLEHYDCGAVQPEDDYENNICPQCKKELKGLGVDYRVLPKLFICLDCEERFPDPNLDFNCIQCGNKFTFDEANWIHSPTFMWIKETVTQQPNEVSNPEILEILSQFN